MKLKVAATAPKSLERISAKDQAYKKAQAIEAQFEKDLRQFLPSPEAQWFRDASAREKLMPRLYDGKHLSRGQKIIWWACMVASYVSYLMFFLLLAVISYILMHTRFENIKHGLLWMASFLALIYMEGFFGMVFCTFRTQAYSLPLQPDTTTSRTMATGDCFGP